MSADWTPELEEEFHRRCNETFDQTTADCKEFLTEHASKFDYVVTTFHNYHNLSWEYNSDSRMCDDQASSTISCPNSVLEQWLLGYGFLCLIVICVICNAANVAVYNESYFRQSITVRLLTTKALVNTMFVLCCLPSYALVLPIFQQSTVMNELHYHTWTYSIFGANLFGFSAAWITVIISLERYLYVAYPYTAKFWFTPRRVFCAVVCIFIFSGLLHMVYPITRYVLRCDIVKSDHQEAFRMKTNGGFHKLFPSFNPSSPVRNPSPAPVAAAILQPKSEIADIVPQYLYFLVVRDGYKTYETIYHWVSTITMLILPALLLLAMMFGMWFQFHVNHRVQNGGRKRCLTRITVATTMSQLILETPQCIFFTYAGLYGNKKSHLICDLHHFVTFLTLVNASLTFIVYIASSENFRQLFLSRIRGQSVPEHYQYPSTTLRPRNSSAGWRETLSLATAGRLQVFSNNHISQNGSRASMEPSPDSPSVNIQVADTISPPSKAIITDDDEDFPEPVNL